jgi:hypothetical protein
MDTASVAPTRARVEKDCRRCRRASDRKPCNQIAYTILNGDISALCLLGGLGLMLWSAFGVYLFGGDLAMYTAMFPLGNGYFWAINYMLCGIAMWYLVAFHFPPLSSLLIGSWLCVIWTWAAMARTTAIATLQTGNAISIVYILLSLLIVQRSARK